MFSYYNKYREGQIFNKGWGMKMKKRISRIKVCLAIIIFFLVGYIFYMIGYLPIIGNVIAEKKLNKYATTLKKNVQKVETKYDWYNSQYTDIRKSTYTLSYILKNNTIYDRKVTEKIGLEAEKQYSKIKGEFPQNLSFPNGISVWTELDADNYSIKGQRLYLLGIYNRENISEEESGKMPATIAQEFIKLMGEDYNFTGIQLNYFDKNGGYTIEISANTFKKLEYQDMLKKTRKVQEE